MSRNKPRVFADDDEEEGAQLFNKRQPARKGAAAQVLDKDDEIQRQEQDLDEIHESVKIIHDMSSQIHNTLQDQNAALEDMENHASHVQTSLQQVTERTNALVQKAGGPRPFAISAFIF